MLSPSNSFAFLLFLLFLSIGHQTASAGDEQPTATEVTKFGEGFDMMLTKAENFMGMASEEFEQNMSTTVEQTDIERVVGIGIDWLQPFFARLLCHEQIEFEKGAKFERFRQLHKNYCAEMKEEEEGKSIEEAAKNVLKTVQKTDFAIVPTIFDEFGQQIQGWHFLFSENGSFLGAFFKQINSKFLSPIINEMECQSAVHNGILPAAGSNNRRHQRQSGGRRRAKRLCGDCTKIDGLLAVGVLLLIVAALLLVAGISKDKLAFAIPGVICAVIAACLVVFVFAKKAGCTWCASANEEDGVEMMGRVPQ